MTFVPSRRSFWSSILHASSPAATAGSLFLLLGYQMSRFFLALSALWGLVSVPLLLQTVFVHLQRLDIDERAIRLSSPWFRVGLAWSDIENAVLRERVNAVTRTDRLLQLEAAQRSLVFNTSTLDPAAEEALLAEVRRRVRLVVYRDAPSL